MSRGEASILGLFLVQHGQAMTAAQDPERPLTPKGVESVERVATWAVDVGVVVRQIRHSGRRRAEQTAEIFAEALKPSGGLLSTTGLAPNDDVAPVADTALTELTDAMLVGHLPFLSRFVGYLVAGEAERQVVRFRNAGIVCLSEEEGSWSVQWVMTPDLLAR